MNIEGWNFQSYLLTSREQRGGYRLNSSPMAKDIISHCLGMKASEKSRMSVLLVGEQELIEG